MMKTPKRTPTTSGRDEALEYARQIAGEQLVEKDLDRLVEVYETEREVFYEFL